MLRKKTFGFALLILALVVTMVLPAYAQSTTKTLSTNFTLVNLGSEIAHGAIAYYKPDGTAWRTPLSFTLAANGGQGIYRQYDDALLTAGAGSVVVSADQPTGAVVQVLARGQNPTTSGAYSGITESNSSYYVPLAARMLTTSSGLANTQIVVQNAGSAPVDIAIDLVGASSYTKSFTGIAANASVMYDLALENPANVPAGWYGSAVVRATTVGGTLAVVSNFFTGDAMQTFNAFPASAPATQWFVPLFTSRLANSLSTPIAVQNLSGGSIAAHAVTVACKSAISSDTFTLDNATIIADKASYYFNPVTDLSIPALFYGACIVQAPSPVVVFVQMRFVSTGEAAAYEAIRGGGTDKKLIVPLVAKRLGNGFATAVTIQNLDTGAGATVDLTYTPSPDYGGSATPVTILGVPIAAGASLIQNQRTIDGVPQLPVGWFGTLTVTSNKPLGGFVQLTFMRDINPGLPSGDNYMAHAAFTQP